MKKIIIIIISIFLLTQNNDYHELNDLAIVNTITIDYYNNNYNLYFQTQNYKDNDKYIIYNSKGSTINNAFKNINTKSPNKPYYKHLEVIYLTQNIDINNLKEIINYFTKNNITRNEFYIVIINNNNIDKIINTPTTDIKKIIKNNYHNKPSFDNILNDYLNPNNKIIIPKITIKNNTINLSNTYIPKEP